MALDHTKATATVTVTGLSVGCYNPDTRKWEVALLRHPRHKLTINVTTKFPNNQSTQTTFEVLDPNNSIHIDAVEPVIPNENEVLFTQDPFDRKNLETSHPEDFRWIIDLEKEFNGGAQIDISKPQHPVTGLFVSYPILYADRNDKLDDMQLVKFAGGGQSGGPPEDFGTLGETAKADITCQPGGSVVLRIEGPMGVTLPLPHIEGATHEIKIDNDCPERPRGKELAVEPQPSDFKLYFDLFKPQTGDAFDLKPKFGGQEGSDAVCNNTFLGSRTSLLPL